MKRLVTMVLSLMLGASLFADNELVVGDINMSATVDQIGGASITIPIEVPAGVNGMQPNLALVYNSHSGYGLAGWGWDLAGISSIQRTGKTLYHDSIVEGVKFDDTDNLSLDGERLILTSGINLRHNSIYRTERESFNQVTCINGTHFSVESKDGRTSLYGTTANSRSQLSSYISQITDANGNYITYDYNSTNQEITLNRIKYTYNENTQAVYTIQFEYIEAPINIKHYIGDGLAPYPFIIRSHLLSKINIKSGYSILYSYNFAYDTSQLWPKLISVEKVANNGDKFPATVITWNTITNKPEVTTSLPQSHKDKTVFGDFNQDGKTDFISYSPDNSTFIIYTNTTSNGVLSFRSSTFNSGHTFHDLRAADYNGDGRTDLVGRYVENKKNRVTYLIANGTSFTNHSDYISLDGTNFLVGDFDGDACDEILIPESYKMYSFGQGYVTLPQINVWSDETGRIYSMGDNCVPFDFNGNGKTDILLTTSTHYYIFEYDNNTTSLLQKHMGSLTSIHTFYGLGGIRYGDFNGDGKTDILSIHDGENYAVLATVYYSGTVQAWTEELISPFIQVADINQDGMDDIVNLATHRTENKAYVCVGISNGNGFVYDNQVLDSYSSSSDINIDNLFYRDMYGTGACDLIYLKDGNTVLSKQLYTEGKMLVDNVTDGMGNTYDFTYKSIANSNVYTNTRVGGGGVLPLVSPFYVVSDYTAPYTSLSYHYKNGRYHTQGKGFFGFEEVTTTDNLSQTRKKDICYLTTAHLCYYPYSTTTTTLDGDTISYLKYRYSVREMGGKRIFPHHSGYEYTDHLTGIKETLVSLYDNNGNLDNQTKTRGDWKEFTQCQYVNAGSWCPNKLSMSRVHNRLDNVNSVYKYNHYFYDESGNLTRHVSDSTSNNLKLATKYAYDDFGNVIQETISGGGQTRTRTYSYSTDGRFLLTSTDELGQTTTNTYNSDWGTLLTQTTNAGITRNSYDSFGRLWKTIAPDSVVYTISSQFVSGVPNVRYMAHETRTNSAPVTTYYDAAGKPLFIKKMGHNDRQIYTAYTYYPNGIEKMVSEPYFSTSIAAAASQTFTSDNATIYTYDEYQRPSRMESPEGTTSYVYNGLTTYVNTPTVNQTTKLNLSGFTEFEQVGATLIPFAERPGLIPLYKRVSYTYYPTGHVKTATPDGGSAVTMEYDVQGNRTKLIDPDAGTITNTYNAFGQVLTRSQNVHGDTPVVTTYEYEASSGRLTSETMVGDTTMTKTYTYNTKFKDSPNYIRYNSKDCLQFSYDEYGNNIRFYRKNADGTTLLQRDYYTKGQVEKRSRTSGSSHYAYDEYGNMVQEKFIKKVAWELLEQNARGQVVRERKSGIVTTYTYDNCGRVTSIVAPGVVSLHYTYDAHGNVLTKTDAINNQRIDYSYDYLMRLQSWTINDTVTHSISYDNATGKILCKTDLGTESSFIYDSSSKPHALRGVSGITSDWGDEDMDITYTDFSKIKSIQKGGVEYQITYTPDEQRFKSTLSRYGSTTTRYYMPDFEKYVNSVGGEQYYTYLCDGSMSVYNKSSLTRTFYHGYYDAQGSLIALTDSSGNVLARYAYDPWGKRVKPTDWTQEANAPTTLNLKRGYTMHEHLDEFDLINMNGRVYDPAVAQFLSPDPYIQDAGNWLNYNRYAYCYNNPTRYVDPDGEFAVTAFLLGMVASAAIDYGTQVAFNYLNGYKGKKAWVDQVDFFDVAVSGIVGGVTAGIGTAVISDYSRYIELGEMFLTSAVNFKGGEWQFSTMNEFMSDAIIGMVSQAAIEGIAWGISDCVEGFQMKNVSTNSTVEIGSNVNSSSLSLSQHNVSPYSVGDVVNVSDPKIGLKLEGHHTMSFMKDGYKIIYNTHTQKVLKSIPVSRLKWDNALKSYQFYHPGTQHPY